MTDKLEFPKINRPIGLTDHDMHFLREVLMQAVSSGSLEEEEEAAHAARLIHRFGRAAR